MFEVEKMKYKINDFVESHDFEHGQEFVKVEDVILLLNAISVKLLPLSGLGQIEYIRHEIKRTITELEEK